MKEQQKQILLNNQCPLCKAKIKIATGQFGEFISCSRFPFCKFTTSIQSLENWTNIQKQNKQSDILDSQFYIQDKYQLALPKKFTDILLNNLKTDHKGFVYFIKIEKNNLIKIGKSSNLINRLCCLASELGQITPIWLIETRFYSAMEVFFHQLFNEFLREKNEYFDIPTEYLIEVSKIKIFLGEEVKVIDKFNKPLLEALKKRKEYIIEDKLDQDVIGSSNKNREFWKEYYKNNKK